MRRILRKTALGMVVFGWAGWLLLGANRGWTKTSVTHWVKDPVTEIEGPVIESRFVPGVDLLAVVLAGSGFLFGVSFFVARRGPGREEKAVGRGVSS